MTKTIRAAQQRRAKAVRRKLDTIIRKLSAVLATVDPAASNDAENLAGKLEEAKQAVEEGREFYCVFL